MEYLHKNHENVIYFFKIFNSKLNGSETMLFTIHYSFWQALLLDLKLEFGLYCVLTCLLGCEIKKFWL